MKIRVVKGLEIIDSRGNPTVEVVVKAGNFVGKASIPSGVSKSSFEAVELRDCEKRYNGLGVRKVVDNVKLIEKKLIGFDVCDQEGIDSLMVALDDTENKARLGANAMLGVSLACARVGAQVKGVPLYKSLGKSFVMPVPYMNMIGGGVHAYSGLSFQEYHIVPKAKSFSEMLRIGTEIYHDLGKKLKSDVGDEGAYSCKFRDSIKPLDVLSKVIDDSGQNVHLSLDIAASTFYKNGRYVVDGKTLSSEKLMTLYEDLIKKYNIVSIEDPFSQEDWMNFYLLSQKFKKLQVVGDDLLATNVNRIRKAIKFKSCNCLLLKVNQIGTLTEALYAAKLAFKSEWGVMVSHRSGETTDDFVSDLAVGIGCGMVKFGAPCRGERTAKYNRLLEIENKFI